MNKLIDYETHYGLEINSKKYGLFIALIDKEDYNTIKNYNWHLKPENNGNFYAHTNIWKNNKRTGTSMHRLIYPEFKMIDHINGNGLDNRRNNLRESSYQLNNKNKTKRKNAASKYKGVYKKKNKWAARATFDLNLFI